MRHRVIRRHPPYNVIWRCHYFNRSKSKTKGKKSNRWVMVDPEPPDLAMGMSSQESITSQMSLPSVPHEESILEEFFQLVSQADYHRAKELVDSEKDGHKMCYASSWGEILQCLSQLAMAEKGYANLVFLGQKRFSHLVRPKDSLKSIYNLLLQEFLRMENILTPSRMDVSAASQDVGSELLLAHISGQMGFFLRARSKMIEFYEQLNNLGSIKQWVNFDDLVMMCEEILKTYMKGFHHPLLAPMKTIFSLECESLCHLLHAQIHLSSWSFLAAVVQLHYAHSKLTNWANMVPVKEVKSSFGRSASKSAQLPSLLTWLSKFKGLLLSKFGLYFHDVLAKQTIPAEMKANLAKAPEDFFGRLQTFHKKTDASSVFLVLDNQGGGMSGEEEAVVNVEGGYTHPDKYRHPDQGRNKAFPSIFSYPSPSDRPVHASHWPVILRMMDASACSTVEAGGSRIKFLQEKAMDKKPLSSYFVTAVEPRIHLIVVFESKKNEKDSTINSFMTEFSFQLRCLSILAALKQFART